MRLCLIAEKGVLYSLSPHLSILLPSIPRCKKFSHMDGWARGRISFSHEKESDSSALTSILGDIKKQDLLFAVAQIAGNLSTDDLLYLHMVRQRVQGLIFDVGKEIEKWEEISHSLPKTLHAPIGPRIVIPTDSPPKLLIPQLTHAAVTSPQNTLFFLDSEEEQHTLAHTVNILRSLQNTLDVHQLALRPASIIPVLKTPCLQSGKFALDLIDSTACDRILIEIQRRYVAGTVLQETSHIPTIGLSLLQLLEDMFTQKISSFSIFEKYGSHHALSAVLLDGIYRLANAISLGDPLWINAEKNRLESLWKEESKGAVNSIFSEVFTSLCSLAESKNYPRPHPVFRWQTAQRSME